MTKIFDGDKCHTFDNELAFNEFRKQFRLIEAAGGLIENANGEYLVIDRRGYIDLPKGKKEAGETNEQNAIREVGEETGLTNVSISCALPCSYHIYELNGSKVLKCTHWYKMKVDGCPDLTPQTEEDIVGAKWVSKAVFRSLADKTYTSLREIFETA